MEPIHKNNIDHDMRKLKRYERITIGVLCLIILVNLGVMLFLLFHQGTQDVFSSFLFPRLAASDPAGVQDGALPDTDPEELARRVQEKADEQKMSVHINSNPVFDAACKEGNIRIENPQNSYYHQQVKIYLEGEEEPVYESPVIKPNQYIEYCALSRQLPSGDHKAVAYFYALDPETGQTIGQAGAQITITVK